MKHNKLIVSSLMLLFLVSFMGGNSGKGAVNAGQLELSSSTATVGFAVSVKATGLTDGTLYHVVAIHSAGNITAWTSASGTEDYVSLLFTSTDSDNQVQITLELSTDDVIIDTVYLTLKAPSIPGSEFFTGIIGPLVIIAVVVGLAGIFAYKKFRK